MTPQQTIETEPTRTQSFAEWLQQYSRAVTIVAILLVLGGLGYWYYQRSAEIRRANAERALGQAKQSLSAGNPALAQSDLQKLATRYKGTPAGAQAAMLLAQLDFDQGKFPDGLKALEPYQSSRASGPLLAAVWSLAGDGQMGSGKPADAAASYRKAADATSYPGEKAMYMTRAARALMLAGKDAEAKDIWQKLVDDPAAEAVHTEAEVRLGELEVKAASRS